MDVIPVTFAPVNVRALYGMPGSELRILEGRRLVQRVLQLRRELNRVRPDLIVTGGGARYLYLATRFSRFRYVLHQHQPPYKSIFLGQPRLYLYRRRRIAAEIEQTPLYRHAHQFLPTESRPWRALTAEVYAVLDERCIRAAQRITVLSQQCAYEVQHLHQRTAIVVRGALPSLQKPPEPGPRSALGIGKGRLILAVTRLDPYKRVDLIIRAFASLLDELPTLRLCVGGTGPEEERLRTLCTELGVNERVNFVGFIPEDLLPSYYSAAEVFALADWTEYGITVYEALRGRCKVVCPVGTEVGEEALEGTCVVHAWPVVEDYAHGLRRALDAPSPSGPKLSAYSWETYFATALGLGDTDGGQSGVVSAGSR